MLTPIADVLIRMAGAVRPPRPCEETCRLRRHFAQVGTW